VILPLAPPISELTGQERLKLVGSFEYCRHDIAARQFPTMRRIVSDPGPIGDIAAELRIRDARQRQHQSPVKAKLARRSASPFRCHPCFHDRIQSRLDLSEHEDQKRRIDYQGIACKCIYDQVLDSKIIAIFKNPVDPARCPPVRAMQFVRRYCTAHSSISWNWSG
jgi:hypothetical protein